MVSVFDKFKFKPVFKKGFLEDPYELSAMIAFGIGCPFILVIFSVTLCLLK